MVLGMIGSSQLENMLLILGRTVPDQFDMGGDKNIPGGQENNTRPKYKVGVDFSPKPS
jgi:hypothetical protein